MNKKTLSEDDISAKYITPAVAKAGWDEATQIRRQVYFTKGRIIVRGRLVSRGKAKRADYVLYCQGIPIALIEAKDNSHAVGDGMQQALEYAQSLAVPFVFTSNGHGFLYDLQSAGNAGEYYTPRAVTAFMAARIDPRPGEILFDPACGTGGFLTCAIRHMRERYVKRPKHEQALQAGLRAVEKKQLPHMLCVTNMLLHGIEDPSFVRHDNTLARPYVSYGQSDRVDIILTNPPFGGKEEDGIESNFPAHFRTKETADLFLALFIRLLKPGGRAAVVLPDGSLFGEGVKTRLKEHLLQECDLHTIVRLPNSVFRPYASIGTNLLFFEKGEPTREVWCYEHRVPEGQKGYSMTKPIRVEHLQGCVDWWGGAERKGRQQTEQAWRVGIEEIKARNYNLDFKNPHTVAADHGDPEALLAELDEAERQAAALREQLKGMLAEALLRCIPRGC